MEGGKAKPWGELISGPMFPWEDGHYSDTLCLFLNIPFKICNSFLRINKKGSMGQSNTFYTPAVSFTETTNLLK